MAINFCFAQDTINITSALQPWLNGNTQSIKLSLSNGEIELAQPSIINRANKLLITASIASPKGDFLFKNFNGNVSGYIHFEDGKLAYQIQKIDDNIVAISSPLKSILIEKKTDASANTLSGPEASIARRLPIGNNLTAGALALESKPGSAYVLYLDFDGENISGMGYNFWNMTNTNATDNQIRTVWEVVAADFAAFDLNVTTNRAIFDATDTLNKGWCVFGNNSIGGAAGLSFVGIFGTGKASVVSTGAAGLGTDCGSVASHELGHLFGLSHDGQIWPSPSVEYYGGNSDWSPIMGTFYGKSYVTWSKGEYTDASKKEDDIAIIASNCAFRADDNISANALILGAGDSINWQENSGFVETVNDVDTFTFEMTAQGNIHLLVGTATIYTNLDVEAKLLNSAFTVLTTSNKSHSREAEFTQNLPAGKYYLLIKGGSEPAYFSNYSSYGYYEITGTIENYKKADYDVVVSKISGMTNFCGDNVSADIELKNVGNQNINGGVVKVYVDTVLDTTINVNSIAAQGTVSFNGIKFYTTGTHQIKVEYLAAPGIVEQSTKNNSMLKDYNLSSGLELNFATDLLSYTNNSTLKWNIKNQNNTTVLSSSDMPAIDEVTTKKQKFCLAPGCYNFELSGNFNLCSSNYNAYVNGTTYWGGDIVAYQGKVYKAKWWTQKLPTTGDWENIGTCNQGPYFAEMKNIDENAMIYTTTSAQFASTVTQSFCVNNITSTAEIQNSEIVVYPNPAINMITIESNMANTLLRVYDLNGKQIFATKMNEGNHIVDVSSWTQGIYFLTFSNDNNTQTIKLIK